MACFINIYLACFYLYYSLKDPLPCLFFLAGRSFRGILKRESLSNSNKEDKFILYMRNLHILLAKDKGQKQGQFFQI